MEIIGTQSIHTFNERGSVQRLSSGKIRKGSAATVTSYLDLATKVAELQFRNRDFVLMFRGQPEDFKNRLGYSSIKPTLMRGPSSDQSPSDAMLERRFARLKKAEAALVREYEARKLLGRERLARQQILRWSILQHYEICETPLLDVSQSLRIAASFASLNGGSYAYLMVLGIPNVSGAITASAEAGIQSVRLASVCPPTAVRPHIQEGYLLGEYPQVAGAGQKLLYSHAEMDFGRRLIAKFRFDPDQLWEKSGPFPKISRSALYPAADQDPLCELAEAVKVAIKV